MFRATVKEILTGLEGLRPTLIKGSEADLVAGLSTDSRKIPQGALFVPLVGEKFDGHDFIGQALERNAGGILVQADRPALIEGLKVDCPVIRVEDTLAGLGLIARGWRRRFELPILAVSGSMGKSTTKEMIAQILALSRKVHRNAGNLNNLIGLPLTLLDLDETVRTGVVELGINQPGEMERLVAIAEPQAGLLTNIGPVHLEYLTDLEGVARAKTALWRGMKPGSTIVVNLDDPYLAQAAEVHEGLRVTFGLVGGPSERMHPDVLLVRSEPGPKGLAVELRVRGEAVKAVIPALGRFQGLNAAAACAGALAMGTGVEEMIQGLNEFQPLAHRMRILEGPEGLVILDDTYNANPEAVEGALQTIREMAGEDDSRSAAVLGQMAELGKDSKAAHQRIGKQAAALGLDILIVLGPHAQTVLDAARTGGLAQAHRAEDLQDAAEKVLLLLGEGDKVLIKGSRVAGLERLVKMLQEEKDGA